MWSASLDCGMDSALAQRPAPAEAVAIKAADAATAAGGVPSTTVQGIIAGYLPSIMAAFWQQLAENRAADAASAEYIGTKKGTKAGLASTIKGAREGARGAEAAKEAARKAFQVELQEPLALPRTDESDQVQASILRAAALTEQVARVLARDGMGTTAQDEEVRVLRYDKARPKLGSADDQSGPEYTYTTKTNGRAVAINSALLVELMLRIDPPLVSKSAAIEEERKKLDKATEAAREAMQHAMDERVLGEWRTEENRALDMDLEGADHEYDFYASAAALGDAAGGEAAGAGGAADVDADGIGAAVGAGTASQRGGVHFESTQEEEEEEDPDVEGEDDAAGAVAVSGSGSGRPPRSSAKIAVATIMRVTAADVAAASKTKPSPKRSRASSAASRSKKARAAGAAVADASPPLQLAPVNDAASMAGSTWSR